MLAVAEGLVAEDYAADHVIIREGANVSKSDTVMYLLESGAYTFTFA